MKFPIQILVTLAICLLLQLFFPWWTLAIGAFVVAFLFDSKSFTSFAAGFLATGILWLSMAAYVTVVTDSILTSKLNQLLSVNSLLLTLLIGGLAGGMASLTGSLFRKI